MSSMYRNCRPVPGIRFGSLERVWVIQAVVGLLLSGWAYATQPDADQPGNWLYIEFGASQQVRLSTDDSEVVRPLSRKPATKCQLDTAGALSDLLSFSSPSGAVGWRPDDRRIGVNGTSNGSPCTEIRNRQSIQFGLGGLLEGQSVVDATFNLMVTKAADILVTAYNDSADGSTIVHQQQVSCSKGVCPVVLLREDALTAHTRQPSTWNRIVMETKTKPTGEAGAWSLGTSRLELMPFIKEGDLDCGQSVVEGEATLRRLDDATDGTTIGSDCTLLPYRLDFDGKQVIFLADYDVLPEGVEPAFEWQVRWDPIPVPLPANAALESPLTVVTFEDGVPLSVQQFLPTDPEYVVDACVGTPVWDTQGTPEQSDDRILSLELVSDVNYDMSGFPGTQYGCYLRRSLQLESTQPAACPDGSGYPAGTLCVPVQVDESGFVRGDWTLSKTTLSRPR